MGLCECQVCGRKYRSLHWLSRHMDAKHGGATASEEKESLPAAQERAHGGERRQPDLEASSPEMVQHRELLALACQGLEVDLADVLSYHINDESVVLIEGPAGRKRVWPRKENG